MIGFITTKKQISTVLLIIFLSIILLVAVIWKAGNATAATNLNQSDEKVIDKIAFIENLGYTVDRTVKEESKEINVPTTFSGMYEKYQQIQLEGGYDLTKYAGMTVTVYAYKLVYQGRSDVYAHLVIYNETVIGGDIAALSVSDGFIYPLVKK